jgi:[ribosomal protein S18]-alanine N-acetyltransferase
LTLAKETVEAPQWPRQEYERILLFDPSRGLSYSAVAAHSGRTLAGFAIASLSRTEKFAEIETIVVHPRFRRGGIGGKLLTSLKTFAQAGGATVLRLEVRESNMAAIALYRAHGFQDVGRRPSYYLAPPEDALLFEVSLALPQTGEG